MERALTRVPSRIASVALTAAIAASSAAPAALAARGAATTAGAAFAGRTAQGMGVRLGRPHAGSRAFRYQARLSCSDDSTFTDAPFTDQVRVQGERFSLRRSTDAGAVHVVLTGVVRGAIARGTIRITERYSEVPDSHGDTPLNADGGILCDSGTVGWRAKLAGHAR